MIERMLTKLLRNGSVRNSEFLVENKFRLNTNNFHMIITTLFPFLTTGSFVGIVCVYITIIVITLIKKYDRKWIR